MHETFLRLVELDLNVVLFGQTRHNVFFFTTYFGVEVTGLKRTHRIAVVVVIVTTVCALSACSNKKDSTEVEIRGSAGFKRSTNLDIK